MSTDARRRARQAASVRARARVSAVCLTFAALVGLAAGCVGHVLGMTDVEVERLRRIVAALEAKNAELVEEVIELRSRLPGRDSGAPGAQAERPEGAAPKVTESGTCRD